MEGCTGGRERERGGRKQMENMCSGGRSGVVNAGLSW